MTSSSSMVKTTTIEAAPSLVWRVLTRQELMQRWMWNEAISVTSQWQEGAAIVIQGLLHGLPFENRGTILHFAPETTFAYSYWSTLSGERLEDRPENHTVVRFDLSAAGGATLLTLTLSDFVEPSIRPHANLYWGGTLPILKAMAEQLQAGR
jgi:uncharacterized protein YndB with AHSA1/START domain